MPAGNQGARRHLPGRAVHAPRLRPPRSSTGSGCITASRSSAACRSKDPGKHDWQDNGEARHVGVRLECGIRLENVYVPAGGDTPDRTVNPKFGQKLDFIERMTRWSEGLDEPTIIVGDFNVAPLECDVWSHKALLNVRQPHAGRGRGARPAAAGARLDRHRPQVRARRPSAASPGGATARPTGPRTTAAAGSTICGRRPSSPAHLDGPRGARAVPQLGAAVRPCAADLRDRRLSDARRSARAIAALRAGRAGADRRPEPDRRLLAVETATQELLDLLDPEPCAHGC